MRKAECHPDRKHHCKGLCEPCYQHQGHLRRMQNPEYKEKNRKRSRAWAIDNPERSYKADANKHLKRRFGISLDEYNAILKEQNGVCKLCGKPESIVIKKRISRLAVDHCHVTGKIRGLLCFKCNTSIAQIEKYGLLKDIEIYLRGDDVKKVG